MSNPIEAARAFYAALARGDVPGVVDALHPDLHWTEAAGFPYYGGTWRSPREVVEKLLVPLQRDWDGFSATVIDFVVAGDRVVSFGRYAGLNKATGRAMQAPFVHDWQVLDGKLARFDMHTDTWLVRQAMTA
jgi:ketosteroid isomerase-like protein